MSAIPIPRKTSRETSYDIDAFIDQLLASRKFDELTEVFADKAAYKIKNLDQPSETQTPTVRTDVDRIIWSKKSHKNTDNEQTDTHTELTSIKLHDDDTNSTETRHPNPIISLKNGEILPNNSLRLKYKYLKRNAKKKNSTDHSKLKKKDEDHALDNDKPKDNDDPKETKSEVKEERSEINGSHEKRELYHNDRDQNIKIDRLWDQIEHKGEHGSLEDQNKSEHSHSNTDDDASDGTHPKEEHMDLVRPEFKSKADSANLEHANNTSEEISGESHHGVVSDEKSHEAIGHTKEITQTQEPTTKGEEKVSNITNNTMLIEHTNDMISAAHFRTQISEEEQAKSDEKERRIRNIPDSQLEKLLKEQSADEEMEAEKHEKDTQEEESKEREKLEKILNDRLDEEESLRNAEVIHERSERQSHALGKYEDKDVEERKVEELERELEPPEGNENILERPRAELEEELKEENDRELKQIAAWAAKVPNPRETDKEKWRIESDKILKETNARMSKMLKDQAKDLEKSANISKSIEAASLERAKKILKEKMKFDEQAKAENEQYKKNEYERLNKFLKAKEQYDTQLKEESILHVKQANERIRSRGKAKKKEDAKKIPEKKEKEEDKTHKEEIHVEPMKAKNLETEKEKKKERIQKGKKEEPKKDKKKKTEKVKKIEPKKQEEKPKASDSSDSRAEEESEQITTKEQQIQFRAQQEYQNKLEKEIKEDDESWEESESEAPKPRRLQSQIQRTKPSFNKVNIEPFIDNDYNNRIVEDEADGNDDDSSREDELIIMSSTTNPIAVRREGNKVYTYVQNPEYAEYHEEYAKAQKEHPYNPTDFLK